MDLFTPTQLIQLLIYKSSPVISYKQRINSQEKQGKVSIELK